MSTALTNMRLRSKLSKKRQALVVEYIPLANMLAKFFVQARPSWQRGVLYPDLQSEGYLALTKAARTYDQSRLPYPKAYFARAIMNAMYKWIKKATRQPCDWKMSLAEAEEFLPVMEHPDYLRLAIEDLSPEDKQLAEDRFESSLTLRRIAEEHQISIRIASVRSRELAKRIAQSLDIQLPRPAQENGHQQRGSRVSRASSPRASGNRRRPKR